MAFISAERLAALTKKADSFDAIVSAIVANNEGITAQEVTAESVVEMISAEQTSAETTKKVQELTAQLETATKDLGASTSRITALEAEVEELSGAAAEEPASVKQKTDKPEAGSFESKMEAAKGNTFAMLDLAKQEGLI